MELNVFYDITVTMNAFFTIVPSASFTFTLTSYFPDFAGVKVTEALSLYDCAVVQLDALESLYHTAN